MIQGSENDSGESAEYVQLMTEHQGAMLGYIISLIPQVDGKSDVLQESNIVLWKKRHEFVMGTDFKGWAFKIAYFQSMAHLKKKKRSKMTAVENSVLEKIADEYLYRSSDQQRLRNLEHCLAKLEPGDRELVDHHYKKRGQLAEYAKATQQSIGRLKYALSRIRGNLKECIEMRGDDRIGGLNHLEMGDI
ncbi:MAG: sigma-70 family RNA polymerase sigma factor [Akkermansiaceae bacterium]|nr:sigma-70 family RNA polymerase sigma factor [Akkermansiaceae bacterium]